MELKPPRNGSATRPPGRERTVNPPARDVQQGEAKKFWNRHRKICEGKKKWLLIIGGILGVAIITVILRWRLRAGAPAENYNGTDADGRTVGNGKTFLDGETVDKDNETARDCERLVYVSANNSDGSFQSSYNSCASKGYELLKEPDIEDRIHCIPQREDFWIYARRDCEPCPVYNTHDGVLRLDSTTMRRFLCDPQAPEPTDGPCPGEVYNLGSLSQPHTNYGQSHQDPIHLPVCIWGFGGNQRTLRKPNKHGENIQPLQDNWLKERERIFFYVLLENEFCMKKPKLQTVSGLQIRRSLTRKGNFIKYHVLLLPLFIKIRKLHNGNKCCYLLYFMISWCCCNEIRAVTVQQAQGIQK
ncbi:uncharacterized protein LOC108717259 isoform X1 [Xenopus laevis]|uniref:Uncharacterized protein LOC108717259 isoform X1 n=2 Tax=Xenopus laevis TaxID=8355 RepID=A0A8J1KTK3_XENLA|nr:uncharacterized protein LOC108717259 isoform X1 [Xenopus laevis]